MYNLNKVNRNYIYVFREGMSDWKNEVSRGR